MIGVALLILGVPLALPLAVVVFVGAFIPLVGATVAGALAALIALVSNGPVTALIASKVMRKPPAKRRRITCTHSPRRRVRLISRP